MAAPARESALMWRALSLLVGVLLAVGVYAGFTGGAAAHAATPREAASGPSASDFGFALAAGSIALSAALIASRPKMRLRR